jgi:hypothetical protein
MPTQTYDTFFEKEELITAEEYLRRRERGEIEPGTVRIAPPDLSTGSLGGFIVKLKTPRYKAALRPCDKGHSYAW